MKTLTVKQIEALNAKDGKIKTASDGASGLFVRAYPSGTKTFFVRVRTKKTDIIKKLGEYPFLSLGDARAKAIALKQEAKTTRTPREAFSPITAGSLMEEWFDKKEREAQAHGKSFYKETQRMTKHVLPKFNKIRIEDLEYTDLVAVLDPLQKSEKIAQLHKVNSHILQFLVYAKGCGYKLKFSVAEAREDLRGFLTKRNRKKHFDTLTDEADIKKFFKGLTHAKSYRMELAIKLHAMTLVRPNELRQAKWREIDFENAVWTIPADKMKMSREHKVPLSKQAIEVLKELHSMSYESCFVFPNQNDNSKPMSNNTERKAIKRIIEALSLPPLVAHGMRSLASTQLNAKGYNPDAVELALAHSADTKNKIRASYNHYDYWEERKEMLQEWSDYLENIIKGE